ncbi:hypothetical protein BH23GEM9_BH23GEM9_00730 [soil metagenome]
MNRTVRTAVLLLLAAIVAGACAVRLGGPSPAEYNAVALSAPAGATAAEIGGRLRASNAHAVLLSADQDSAWFAAVAAESRLELSGPGEVNGRRFAFLSNLEILGDTTLTLEVTGGGSVHMHDALYRVDRYRYLDLMMVRIDAENLRAAVQTLFGYIATDVAADAAVLLAIDGPTPAAADSVAVLMRAHYTSSAECRDADLPDAAGLPIRLLFGPSARISCRSVRHLGGTAPGINARVVVGR